MYNAGYEEDIEIKVLDSKNARRGLPPRVAAAMTRKGELTGANRGLSFRQSAKDAGGHPKK